MKSIFCILFCLTFSFAGFSQISTKDSLRKDSTAIKDTSLLKYKYLQPVDVLDSTRRKNKIRFRPSKKMYRPTRLGSSSPKYDTYEKNKRGAGAVTTNPNKTGSGTVTPPVVDSSDIRMDSIPTHNQ